MARVLGKETFALLAVFAAGTTACSDPVACMGTGRPGIVVQVRDARTGRPAAYQARLIMQSSTRVDTFPDFTAAADSAAAMEILGLMDTPGQFTLIVEKEGYSPWTSHRVVRSTGGHCPSVLTEVVNVNLVPK